MTGAPFATVVMADWSAASTRGPARPTADRCWVAWTDVGSTAPPELAYCRTRHEAEALILRLLLERRGPTLVGFDFPFGYPHGSGLGGGRPLAARLAGLVADGPDGGNNRFAVAAALNAELNDGLPGPFWGCPAGAACATLTPKKNARRGRAYDDHRHADRRLRHRGIQSCWKLYTRGSVGGQILMGMPAIHRLAIHPALADHLRIWPFETGWDGELGEIVIAEIWPSLFDHAVVDHPIRDARQVSAACRWLAADPERLRLALSRPSDLPPESARVCETEEGWILGLGTGLA